MFITPAYAGESATMLDFGGGNMTGTLFLFAFAAIFYFLVIRPQNLRIREHRVLIDALKKGDKIVTGGGVVATVVKAQEKSEDVVVRIAEGVEVTILRNSILSLHGTPPAKAEKK